MLMSGHAVRSYITASQAQLLEATSTLLEASEVTAD